MCIRDRGENEYTFNIYNPTAGVKDVISFSIIDIDDAFENLYSIIMENLETVPDEDLTFTVKDGDSLTLKFASQMGVSSVKLLLQERKDVELGTLVDSGFSAPMTKKQISKLFGKNGKKRRKK